MRPGRKPTPQEVIDAKGNPGKRARRPTLPKLSGLPTGSPPTDQEFKPLVPPTSLRAEALVVWHEAAAELAGLSLLRQGDRQALGRYCETLAHYWSVTVRMHEEGDVYISESAHGTLKRANPLFMLQRQLAKDLSTLEDRFGLTPAARQQIMLRFANRVPALPGDQPSGATSASTPAGDAGLSGDPLTFFRPTGGVVQ